jgi:hypothetical protein
MVDTESPAEVFRLLSDDIRIDILETLAVAQSETNSRRSGPVELTFSDIYQKTDVDNTSKLSYHLGELVGPILRKTENGYAFTHAGEKLVRLILAENYERPPEFAPIEISGQCIYCDATSLQTSLRFQFFVVTCQQCDKPLSGHPVTPTVLRTHSGPELVDMVSKKMALEYRQIREGLCLGCTGSLSTSTIPSEELPDENPFSFLVHDECNHCLREYNGPLVYGVAYHPASVAFHWEYGIDLSTKGMWELHQYADRWTAERRSTTPAEYRVVMRRDSEELHVYLDADVTVTRTERVRERTVE